ncbi:MAG: hypothetical protein JWM05_3613 [Acidimicrobiales bacterium]|nr:hypothetical protein [Acidimicrobiales bacterium]
MARRRRPVAPSTAAPAAGGPIDPDVALFAARVRAQQERERAEKRAAREERQRVDEHARLLTAKDAAATELKRLRQRDRTSADDVARADATYRTALAALITHETGQAPAWAPPPEADEPSATATDAAADPATADDATATDDPSDTATEAAADPATPEDAAR